MQGESSLDEQVTKEIFGGSPSKNYSVDLGAAWEIVTRLASHGWLFASKSGAEGGVRFLEVEFSKGRDVYTARAAPLTDGTAFAKALCEAGLKAVRSRK
jgi:hypothetical protein